MTLAFVLFLLADPSRFETLSSKAAAARQANRSPEAIELYRAAVRLRPAWAEGWWYLGSLLYEGDQFAHARDAFSRFTTLMPKGGAGWGMLGVCEYQTKDYEKALRHLNQAVRLGLGSNAQLAHVIRYHAVVLLTHFGSFEAALQVVIALATDGIDDPGAVAAAGLAGLRVPMLPPEVPAAKREMVFQVGRAVYDTSAQRAAEARREWADLIAKYGAEPEIHYLYGWFLLADDSEGALREWKRELEISPKHVPARLQLAFEYLKREDAAAALPFAQQAVKLDPDSFIAHNALGRARAASGDLKGGIAELETASKLAPEAPEVHVALASAYAKSGRKDDAARERALFLKLKKEREP